MTFQALKEAARLQGYLVFGYSKSITAMLVFGVYKKSQYGLSLCRNDEKIIFINDSLPEKTQTFVLAHELGHITLNHTERDIENAENEADIFAMAVTGMSRAEALSA